MTFSLLSFVAASFVLPHYRHNVKYVFNPFNGRLFWLGHNTYTHTFVPGHGHTERSRFELWIPQYRVCVFSLSLPMLCFAALASFLMCFFFNFFTSCFHSSRCAKSEWWRAFLSSGAILKKIIMIWRIFLRNFFATAIYSS